MRSSTIYTGQLILQLHYLCSKSTKFWANKFRRCAEDDFFDKRRIHFLLISSFSYLIFFIKKETKHTTRCGVKSSTFYTGQFNLPLYFLLWELTKFWANKFRRWEKNRFFLIYHLIRFLKGKQKASKDAARKAVQFQ